MYNILGWLYGKTKEGKRVAREITQDGLNRARLISASCGKNPHVKDLYEMLFDSGFRNVGTWFTDHSAIVTFTRQDRMLLVQLHKDGTLNRLFVELNDNNTARAISKITGETNYVDNAIEILNDVLKTLTLLNPEQENAYANTDRALRNAVNLLRESKNSC